MHAPPQGARVICGVRAMGAGVPWPPGSGDPVCEGEGNRAIYSSLRQGQDLALCYFFIVEIVTIMIVFNYFFLELCKVC